MGSNIQNIAGLALGSAQTGANVSSKKDTQTTFMDIFNSTMQGSLATTQNNASTVNKQSAAKNDAAKPTDNKTESQKTESKKPENNNEDKNKTDVSEKNPTEQTDANEQTIDKTQQNGEEKNDVAMEELAMTLVSPLFVTDGAAILKNNVAEVTEVTDEAQVPAFSEVVVSKDAQEVQELADENIGQAEVIKDGALKADANTAVEQNIEAAVKKADKPLENQEAVSEENTATKLDEISNAKNAQTNEGEDENKGSDAKTEDTHTIEALNIKNPITAGNDKFAIKVGEVVDTQKPEFVQNMGAQISQAVENGLEEVHIKLSPENLGNILIKLTREAGKTAVSIFCENAKAVDLLGKNVAAIANAIETNTGSAANVTVSENNDLLKQRQDDASQGNAQHQQQQEQENQKNKKEKEIDFIYSIQKELRVKDISMDI